MSVAIGIMVGLLAMLFTVVPLFLGGDDAAEPAPEAEVESPADRLRARRDVIYEGIRDLDFELAMGKLTAEDHAEVRGGLLEDAARVLAELDAVGPADGLAGWIEAQVAARRTASACAKCGRLNPRGASFCDGCGGELARTCRSCAATLRADARFCGGCGAQQ